MCRYNLMVIGDIESVEQGQVVSKIRAEEPSRAQSVIRLVLNAIALISR